MENFFLLTIGIFLAGSIGSLLLSEKPKTANIFSHILAALGSLSGIALSLNILINKIPLSINYPTSFPLLSLSISIDTLSAFFILVISTVALTSSIYGISYMQKYAKEYDLGVFGFFYNLFILSLILVVSANNGLYFLFAWEMMSLSSYFLVIFENKIRENIQAGILYLVMTHVGTAFILISFLLLYSATGSFNFDDIRALAAQTPATIKNSVFILALIGFGTKAGIIPLHIWLPRAHPAAPSHVSALMSGVMIKTAIFMMIKLFLDLIPTGEVWWGIVVLTLGAVSSLLGVLYAITEHDIKKLLAYHSVENIGIILMGLGSAMVFYSLNLVPLAILGLVAALYHTMNHAIFKSLLFLGAGSVVYQTHTHNIEEYGGLIKKMPYTAFFFLIGAIAISALPPFNGFASEWLTYQSLFSGIAGQDTLVQASFILAIASLAFTGGLAAMCFVKAFGVSFLAKPRSKEAQEAKESPLSMNVGMAILTILCLVLGIFAGSITPELVSISKTMSALQTSSSAVTAIPEMVSTRGTFASLNLPAVFLALLGTFTLVVSLVYLKTRNQKVEMVDTWDCGAPPLTVRSEITSTGFARALIIMLGRLLRPAKETLIDYGNQVTPDRYFPDSRTIHLDVPNLYEQYLYKPFQRVVNFASARTTLIQSGNVNLYLLYIFITLVALLMWARY